MIKPKQGFKHIVWKTKKLNLPWNQLASSSTSKPVRTRSDKSMDSSITCKEKQQLRDYSQKIIKGKWLKLKSHSLVGKCHSHGGFSSWDHTKRTSVYLKVFPIRQLFLHFLPGLPYSVYKALLNIALYFSNCFCLLLTPPYLDFKTHFESQIKSSPTITV